MVLTDAPTDASELSEEVKQIVSDVVPAYNALVITSKLNVIHAVISKILVDEVFGVYFFGLSNERVSQIQTMEQYLRTIGEAIWVIGLCRVLWACFVLVWTANILPRVN